MNPLPPNTYPQWAEKYISQVEGDVLNVLERQSSEFPAFINALSDKADYAYAPGKWTIKELIGHVIDTERILTFRLLCFARGEQAAFPGFEEDDYVKQAHFAERSLHSLAEEFSLLRKSNLYLFASLNNLEMNRMGTASGHLISVAALRMVIAGHVIHHAGIIKEKYLV